MRNWTHKVVKMSRGEAGKWFAHRAAMTGTLAECDVYARNFAAQQTTGGHRITVQTRGRQVVAAYPGAAN